MSEEPDPLEAMKTIIEAMTPFEEERQVRIMLSAAILLGIAHVDNMGKPILPGSRPVREAPKR